MHVRFMVMYVYVIVIWLWIENWDTWIELLSWLTWLFMVIFWTTVWQGSSGYIYVCTVAEYVHIESVYADFTVLMY